MVSFSLLHKQKGVQVKQSDYGIDSVSLIPAPLPPSKVSFQSYPPTSGDNTLWQMEGLSTPCV